MVSLNWKAKCNFDWMHLPWSWFHWNLVTVNLKLHNLFCIYRVEKLVISIFKRLPTFIQVAVYKSRQQRREKRLLIYKHYLIIGYLVKVSTNFAYVTGLYPCLTKICTIFSKFHANIIDIYMQILGDSLEKDMTSFLRSYLSTIPT